MDRKIICLLSLLCFVPITGCSIITDSGNLMGTREPKEHDEPISDSDAATFSRGLDSGKAVFTSDAGSEQKNENQTIGIDAAMADSTGADATIADSTGVDAAMVDSSAGSVDSSDKKDPEKPTFCQSDDICHDHGVCNHSDGTCTCNNENMTSDCSACESGYIGYPDCRDDPCDPDPCNEHADCDQEDGTCTCKYANMTSDCSACESAYTGYPECDDRIDTYFDWVTIEGGTFMMGSVEETGYDDEHPRHEVTVPTFKLLKTEVTVAQYSLCVDASICSEPSTFYEDANWGKSGRENHPINFVTWFQAKKFAEWLGGRLPSEAEWEYAARSRGQDNLFPWGNEDATCEHAVMVDCGNASTMEACSKPSGNTVQGLCDMAGNVWEWLEDNYHDNYNGAPSNGQAWIDDPRGETRVTRGGSWFMFSNSYRTAARYANYAVNYARDFGFRVVLNVE